MPHTYQVARKVKVGLEPTACLKKERVQITAGAGKSFKTQPLLKKKVVPDNRELKLIFLTVIDWEKQLKISLRTKPVLRRGNGCLGGAQASLPYALHQQPPVVDEIRHCPEEEKPGVLKFQIWSRLSANMVGDRALGETYLSPCGNGKIINIHFPYISATAMVLS
jgi:hypothetical protein